MLRFLIFTQILFLTSCVENNPVRIWSTLPKSPEIETWLKAELGETPFKWNFFPVKDLARKVEMSLGGISAPDVILGGYELWHLELEQKGHLFQPAERISYTPFVFFVDPKAKNYPKSWNELLDPRNLKKWEGKISIANPRKNPYTLNLIFTLHRVFGAKVIDHLEALKVHWMEDHENSIFMVSKGAAILSIDPLTWTHRMTQSGSNLIPVFPSDFVVPVTTMGAILKSTQRPDIAKRILRFARTPKFQEWFAMKKMYYPVDQNLAILPDLPPQNDFFSRIRFWSPELKSDILAHAPQIWARIFRLSTH